MKNNDILVDQIRIKSSYYLDSIQREERVLNAMRMVDRKEFLPDHCKNIAYEDIPLPIGYNQTCSQPSMVAFMLDKLDIQRGDKILEIGCGCGYAACIASILCGENGIIYASEIVPQLAQMARKNVSSYNNIIILDSDGSLGYKSYGPFNKIFLSAGVSSNNFNKEILLEQLTENGILLYPETYGNMYKIAKKNNKFIKEVYYGVSFVPLKGENS